MNHTIGYVCPTPLLQNSHPDRVKKKGKGSRKDSCSPRRRTGEMWHLEQIERPRIPQQHLQPDLTRLLLLLLSGPANDSLLAASVTDVVGADPFPLDRPGAEALVVGVVAGEVAVLNQAAAGMPAGEVDDFELFGV